MSKATKKIGIMGGTFDPIHMGHLILGEKAYEQLELDKVLFMPCGNPPHKRNRKGRATDEQRAEMVRLAIEDNPHFELSLIEMHEEGYCLLYTSVLACYIQYADFSEKEREQCLCIHNKFSVLCGLNPGLYHTGSGRMMELKEGIK